MEVFAHIDEANKAFQKLPYEIQSELGQIVKHISGKSYFYYTNLMKNYNGSLCQELLCCMFRLGLLSRQAHAVNSRLLQKR